MKNEKGEDLVSIGEVYLPRMGLYSNDYSTLDELPDGPAVDALRSLVDGVAERSG